MCTPAWGACDGCKYQNEEKADKNSPHTQDQMVEVERSHLQEVLKESLTQKICPTVENPETRWKETAKVIHAKGERIMGITLGKPLPPDIDTWWWNTSV